MTFLLDQGLPRGTVAELATRGLTAEHVGNLGMAKATDERFSKRLATGIPLS